MNGKEITLDFFVEQVETGTSRAKELGITEGDAPEGTYIFNQEIKKDGLAADSACTFTVLDWTRAGGGTYEEKNADEFAAVLTERSGLDVLYEFSIKDDKICNVKEIYRP